GLDAGGRRRGLDGLQGTPREHPEQEVHRGGRRDRKKRQGRAVLYATVRAPGIVRNHFKTPPPNPLPEAESGSQTCLAPPPGFGAGLFLCSPSLLRGEG